MNTNRNTVTEMIKAAWFGPAAINPDRGRALDRAAAGEIAWRESALSAPAADDDGIRLSELFLSE